MLDLFSPMAKPALRPHILVVEDDESITLGLQMNLEAEGYAVSLATDGEAGFRRARDDSFELIILDVMLPRMNGFEVVRALRAENRTTPIIMLSARGAEMDKVMGLELGAEDYITKPFSLAELLARIKAVLRREQLLRASKQPTRVGAGELVINADTRQVWRGDEAVALTATEFDILWCLAEAGGKVVSREEIQTRVWGPEHHGTLRTIDNFMLQLRNKLEPVPSDPKHLLTVRGAGYRFHS